MLPKQASNNRILLKKAQTSSLPPPLKEKILHLKRINLTDRQLCDVELLITDAFNPLKGFLNEGDYERVLEDMRLSSGVLWPIPVALDAPTPLAKVGEEIVLCDKFGNPVAFFTIESIYIPDKKREARKVYGTVDETHSGVGHLLYETGVVYHGGRVEKISLPLHHDFPELRFTPDEVRRWFKRNGWEKVAAFQTRNPIHRAHFELMHRAHKEHDVRILIHPVVGLTKEGDVDYITRVQSYKKVHERYMKRFAKLSLLPLAMRMAGPREALWHALIRKNYGVTHFIVGRDHAGPGNNRKGHPFYGPYDAQQLVLSHANEVGLSIIPQQEMVYVEEKKTYLPLNQVASGQTVKNISGTAFRRMLAQGEKIPAWFSFPEVVDILRKGVLKDRNRGFTLFFTGLSGAGKSTIATILAHKLELLSERKVTFLDGDVVRDNLSKGLGFSREDRNINVSRIGFVAAEIVKHGGIAVCSAIAPYQESREKNRSLISKQGRYIEIHVATPLSQCKKRDPKGLYRKAKEGLIRGVTGIDDPYEKPRNPELKLDTLKKNPHQNADLIIRYLQKENLL